ncbi:MAG: hypothetical protein SGI97_00275 [candidate division Zixibacteria bacterium]|nr:hypothetical protein [candidate division Zixibacteria bacterium]
MARILGHSKLLPFLLIAVIFAGALFFWQSKLDRDPPLFFSGPGQSLSTDPYMYTYHARNSILFDNPNPLGDTRWALFQQSLVSGASYLWMSLTDVSLVESKRVGVLLSLGALLLFILGLTRDFSGWTIAAFTICYCVNAALFTYGRLPYLENGLLFLSALAFLAYSKWGERRWGIVASAAVIAIAALHGKLLGALMFPALLVSVLLSDSPTRTKDAIFATLGFVATGLIFGWLFYGGHLDALSYFASAQTERVQGFPEGLTSPKAFVEHLMAFGFRNKMYVTNPDLLIMTVFGLGALFLWSEISTDQLRQLPRASRFSLFWIIIATIALAPLTYSPHRYSLFFVPAIIILCFTALEKTIATEKRPAFLSNKSAVFGFGFLVWLFIINSPINALLLAIPNLSMGTLIWVSLLPTALITFIVSKMKKPQTAKKSATANKSAKKPFYTNEKRGSRGNVAVAISIVVLSIVVNLVVLIFAYPFAQSRNIVEANADLGEILSEGAVVCGPYATTLTLETGHKAVIYFFGQTVDYDSLFTQFPITHLAIEKSNIAQAAELFPRLEGIQPITSFWIQDNSVQIYNVSKLFGNPQAMKYRESPFEIAKTYLDQHNLASAELVFQSSPGLLMTKSGGLLMAELLRRGNRLQEAYDVFVSLAGRYPTDFSVQLEAGHFIQRLGLTKNDTRLISQANNLFSTAVTLNPLKSEYARDLYNQNIRELSK